jgi:hypothetical protein
MTAKRVDQNQPAIVEAIRQVGGEVMHTHEIGHGCPDLLAVWRGQLYLLEVKSPGGRLTHDETTWHQRWPGPVYIVRSVDDALKAIGALEW